jgi:hypothetical protein
VTFGVRQFQLTLMHRMRDLNAERVEDALREVGADRAEIRAAHRLWMKMAYSRTAPKGMAAFRMALGPPLVEGPRAFGDLTGAVARWRLPYWPELEFEVLTGPDGDVWNQWFIRPGPPRVLGFGDLTPWACVIGDFGAGFPGAVHVEGAAPQHWGVDFTHGGTDHRALFVYGLFQRLARPAELPGATPPSP